MNKYIVKTDGAKSYLENFMHELKLFPILLTDIKVGVALSLQLRYLVALISELRKVIQWLEIYLKLVKLEIFPGGFPTFFSKRVWSRNA